MIHDLFSSGKIYLIRTAVSGRYGLQKLHGMVMSGILGVDVNPDNVEEMYFIFVTRNLKTLMILHMDEAGVDFTKRILFNRKFKIMLEDQINPIDLTRDQLKRLVLDGSYEGDWESIYLKQQLEELKSKMPA